MPRNGDRRVMDVPRMPTRFRADRTDSMTEVRDLRTGVPVWASGGHSPFGGAPLLSPAKADVVIVGSGITGALMALAASQKGLSAIVIDRRPPAQGSTAASTALLQFEIDAPLIRLADQPAAIHIVLRSKNGSEPFRPSVATSSANRTLSTPQCLHRVRIS